MPWIVLGALSLSIAGGLLLSKKLKAIKAGQTKA